MHMPESGSNCHEHPHETDRTAQLPVKHINLQKLSCVGMYELLSWLAAICRCHHLSSNEYHLGNPSRVKSNTHYIPASPPPLLLSVYTSRLSQLRFTQCLYNCTTTTSLPRWLPGLNTPTYLQFNGKPVPKKVVGCIGWLHIRKAAQTPNTCLITLTAGSEISTASH